LTAVDETGDARSSFTSGVAASARPFMSQCRRSKWDFATPVTGKLCALFGPTWYDEQAFLDLVRGFGPWIREAKDRLGRLGTWVDPRHIVASCPSVFGSRGRRLEHRLWIRASGARSHASVRHRAFSPPRSVVADRFRLLARILKSRCPSRTHFQSCPRSRSQIAARGCRLDFPDLCEWTATISACPPHSLAWVRQDS